MKFFLPLILSLFITSLKLSAQDSLFKPGVSTAFFHEKIDVAQRSLLAKDGVADDQVSIKAPDEINHQLTYSATTGIDSIQHQIEHSGASSNQKNRYLRGFTELLSSYNTYLKYKKISWTQLPLLVNSFQDALTLDLQGASILPAIEKYRYSIGQMLLRNIAFEKSAGRQGAKEYTFLKLLEDKPDQLMKELFRDNSYSYADSLIVIAARRVPEDVFTAAQARNTRLGQRVISISETDTLVRLIVGLSNLRTGQMFLPFLDRLNSGELSWDEVAAAKNDSSAYYKLLVQTEVEYAGRLAKADTPMAMKPLADMLKQKSSKLYVNTINGLHEAPASIRFRSIQKLTPEELYYLIVMNEETIYTSSYIYVYRRIFEKMAVKSADSLMQRVNYDRYKKFITMASNYNMLADFLGKMSKDRASEIMTGFVSNLEKGKSNDDVEDAVDVANAFATITQPDIKALMLEQVNRNLDSMRGTDNKKGIRVYHIEKLIMESRNPATATNLTDSLGIPPVYEVQNSYLRDSLGRIIMQMFFLDDGTGKGSFNTLMRLFGNRKKWAFSETHDWVQFTSIKTPVPFMLFANRPLDAKEDLDDKAQKNLTRYLAQTGNNPSITVHRGHSYSLKYTVQKMLPSSKVVLLGSCGAYQNLSDILKVSPEAYIISSKQVGYGEINVALFMYLVEHLKNGKDISWPGMLKSVGSMISAGKKEGYDDYVFPHQNLGALFIKAYKTAQQQEGDNPDF